MKKSTASSSSSRSVVDHTVMESGLRKAKLSVKRSEENSKKKKVQSEFTLSDSEDDLFDIDKYISDSGMHDDEDISSNDDFQIKFSDDELDDDDEPAITEAVHHTTISLSDLSLRAKDQKKRSERVKVKQLFSVVEDIDPRDIQQASHDEPLSELSLSNNAKSIRELFMIHQKRPSRGNSCRIASSTSTGNTFFQDHHKKFETGLQSLPDSFKMPRPNVDGNAMQNNDEAEISLSYLAETIVDADPQSIEKIGSKLIDKLQHIEFRSRQQEEEKMREYIPGIDRPCSNGDKCECLYIGDTKGIKGFIGVSFESVEALAHFNMYKQWPEDIKPRKCVICERKEMNRIFNEFFAGNCEHEDKDHPMRYVGQITYHNKVGDGEYSPYDVIVTDPNSFGKLLYPVVLHSRIFYRIVIRTYNGKELRFYQQNTTLPSSFRVGRTQQW